MKNLLVLLSVFINLCANSADFEPLTLDQLVGEDGIFNNLFIEGSDIVIKFPNSCFGELYGCSIDERQEFMTKTGGEYHFNIGSSFRFRSRGCTIKFTCLQEPLKPFGYHVVYAYGGGHPPRRGHHYEGYLVSLGRTSNSKLVITSPTAEAALTALQEAGIDPSKLSTHQEKPFEVPDEARPLKFDDLFEEKGIFESVQFIKAGAVGFILKFKSTGERYKYSVNYLKPVESKPGEELTLKFGERFKLTGGDMTLEFTPLHMPINTDGLGFSVVMTIDQRSTGKGLSRLEGNLVIKKHINDDRVRMTYPAVAAVIVEGRKQEKWAVMKYEDLIGEKAKFDVSGGKANIESIDFDGKEFTMKVSVDKPPINCFVGKNVVVLQKTGETIAIPVGTKTDISSEDACFQPLPEPLRNLGLHARFSTKHGDLLKEGYFLFTGREKDGKKEMIVTEPYVGAALIALDKARKGPVATVEENKAGAYGVGPGKIITKLTL